MIAPAPALDNERLGKFELLEQIGHGGMATVHRALLRGMGGFERQVVIKRILPELASDAHFVKMFIDEAKLSAQLEHPNIVQIYDFGVVDKTYYLAMEFLEGITLLNFIKKHGRKDPIAPAAAAFVIHQVCLGLNYAHSLERDGVALGLVHRDVSPANVMLTTHGGVKVLDFGIAKAVEAIEREDTRTGTLKGKWSYMSPEQVEGKVVTACSDIFATGIMLWEMLTCRRLFKAKTDYLTLSNVVRAKVPPVTSFRPEVPEVFDRICGRALARNPEDRYQSADEMADALEQILTVSHFGASMLADMVGPLVGEHDLTRQEVSDSQSSSLSDSSVGFVHADESVSSLAKGESAFTPVELGRRRWTLPALIGGGIAALLLVTVTLAIVLSKTDDTTPTTQQPATKAPLVQRVRVLVTSVPPGASVVVVGEQKPRGTTPIQLEFPRDGVQRELELRLPGYRIERTIVAVDQPTQKLTIELEAEPAMGTGVGSATAPDPKGHKPKPKLVPKIAPKIKTPPGPKVRVEPKPKPRPRPKPKPAKVPDLKGGGLADPYAN